MGRRGGGGCMRMLLLRESGWTRHCWREGKKASSIILHQHKHRHHDSHRRPTDSQDVVSMATIHAPPPPEIGHSEGRERARVCKLVV